MPPTSRRLVRPFRRAHGELPLQAGAELRGAPQFFEAAPELRAALARQTRAELFEVGIHAADPGNQWWHTEQLVRCGTSRPCALARSVPTLLLVGGRLPVHAVDLRERTLGFLRLAVALQAPLHEERVALPGQRHLVDLPVAGRAAHAFVHVDGMVEVHVVRQVMDAVPGNRQAAGGALAHGLEEGTVGEKLGVAGHARLPWAARPRTTISRPTCGSSGSRSSTRPSGAGG